MVEVPLPQPFSAALALAHLRHSSFGAVWETGADHARRLLWLGAGPAVPVRFDFSRPGVLAVTGEGAPAALAAAARHLFSLDDDLAACYGALGADAALAPLLARYRGFRIIRAPDLYEALLVAVMGQQVTVAVAQAQRRRLMAALGQAAGGLALYPRPEVLAAAGALRLRELGISRQKARYLVAVAERAATGDLDPDALAALPDQAALAWLTAIPGVGRWTAEVVLMRGLGRPDVLPAADVGLWNAAHRVYGGAERPREAALRALGEGWRPWRSYAALYLWMVLNDPDHTAGHA